MQIAKHTHCLLERAIIAWYVFNPNLHTSDVVCFLVPACRPFVRARQETPTVCPLSMVMVALVGLALAMCARENGSPLEDRVLFSMGTPLPASCPYLG